MSSGTITETLVCRTPGAVPLPEGPPAPAPKQPGLVTVHEDEVTHRISASDIMAYSVAGGLDGVAAWLGCTGTWFSSRPFPMGAIILCLTIEVAKLIGAG